MALLGSSIAGAVTGNTFATGVGAPPYKPGTLMECADGKVYKYIYNAGTGTLTQYYPGYIYGTASNFVVNNAASGLATKLVDGIACTDIPTLEYGWICKKGPFLCYATGAVASIIPIGGVAVGVLAASTFTDVILGYSLNSIAAAGNVVVNLNIG